MIGEVSISRTNAFRFFGVFHQIEFSRMIPLAKDIQ